MEFYTETSVFLYVYDDDNTEWTVPVHIKNELTGDTLIVYPTWSSTRYSGYFPISTRYSENAFWIPDTLYLTASYYDETTKKWISEQILLRPRESGTSNDYRLEFKADVYEGFTDKANFSF